MNTSAFRLGYMTKVAELRKLSQYMYAPGIKNTLGQRREDPAAIRARDEAGAAKIDSMIDQEQDDEDANWEDFSSWGDDSVTAMRDEMARRQERAAVVDRNINDTLRGMSPEARREYLARNSRSVDGKDTGLRSFNASRARGAVLGEADRANIAAGTVDPRDSDTRVSSALNGMDASSSVANQRALAAEKADRASRWSNNRTVGWTPKGQAPASDPTKPGLLATTKRTPTSVARNAVASGRATLKPVPMAGRPAAAGDGLMAFNDAFPASSPAQPATAAPTQQAASPARLKVRYNARTGAYSRADGSNAPWTDREKAMIQKFHTSNNRTTPINWNPTTVTQGFQQSFGKGSAGNDVTVATPVRRRRVASTTTSKQRNGV